MSPYPHLQSLPHQPHPCGGLFKRILTGCGEGREGRTGDWGEGAGGMRTSYPLSSLPSPQVSTSSNPPPLLYPL